MSEIYLTPADTGDVIELSSTLVRKRVLPKSSIDYKGRKIVFDDAYMAAVVESFNDKAQDQVPAQLAGDDNKHNLNVEKFGGEIVGLSVQADGLYADMQLTERSRALLKENPKLGVSAALKNDYARSDGKTYPAVMNHVLLTLDPKVVNLGPWTDVTLSGYDEQDQVIDLSNASYEGVTAVTDGKNKPEAEPVTDEKIRKALEELEFSSDEIDAFFKEFDSAEEIADKIVEPEKAAKAAESEDETGQEQKPETDKVEEPAEEEKVLVSLSNETDIETRLAKAEKALAVARFETERQKYVGKGVPPAFINLAQEILTAPEGSIDIELSNDAGETEKVDPAAVIRKMLDMTAGYVRIASERGHDISLSNEDEDKGAAENEELAGLWTTIQGRSKPAKN